MDSRNAQNKARDGRNRRSSRSRVLETAGDNAEYVATGIFRWATTDHSGIGSAVAAILAEGARNGIGGILDSLHLASMLFALLIWRVVVYAAAIVFTFAVWIPFLWGAVLWMLFN